MPSSLPSPLAAYYNNISRIASLPPEARYRPRRDRAAAAAATKTATAACNSVHPHPRERDPLLGGMPPAASKSKASSGAPSASSTPGPSEWPRSVLETLFSFLALPDLRSCSQVCKSWSRFLNDEDNDVWRLHCVRKLAADALRSELLASLPTYKAKLRAFYHAWNPEDCSRNIYVKSNGFTLHRNPVAQSTDGARGKVGFGRGRHSWEIVWEGPLGTVAVIGIATKEAPNQCHGYVALLGSNDQSWGWNLVDNHLLHNGDSQGNYPQLNNAPKYQVKKHTYFSVGFFANPSKSCRLERGYG